MADVCTTLDSVGNSVISKNPMNLTLLGKKRSVDESDENAEEETRKRSKQDENNSSSEDERPRHDDEEHGHQHQTENGGDQSKSSILKHFYSFIRRKTDDSDEEIRPKEESQERKDRDESRSPHERRSPESFDQYKPLNDNQNGPELLPAVPDHSILDYNAAISRQLSARPAAPNFMDIWSMVAANAIVRAKFNGKETLRNSPPYPAMPTMLGNEHDGRRSFPTPGAPQQSSIPERTMRQNNWAVKVWRDWAIERNAQANLNGKSGPYDIVPLDIKDASVDIMSYWLPRFITEVRRRDKRPYPPDTLMQIASGLQRHLRHVSGRSDITFFDKYSPTFAEFREALKARSDAINSEMSTARRDYSHNISPHPNDGVTEPWTSSLFNLHTAKGLFRAIFYYNCINFHITSMEEHHSLLVSQFRIGYDCKTGQEFIEFTRDSGEVTRKSATRYDPRCMVKVFKKYFKCIPSTGLLYKRPLQSADGTELRFSFNPVGINKLRETFKILFGGRRTGSHLPSIEDDDEKEVLSSQPPRYHPLEDENKRSMKFIHSPRSNTSSGRASLSDFKDESMEENRHPSESSGHGEMSPPRGVISHAPDLSSARPLSGTVEMNSATRYKILDENINNNSSAVEEEDSLTLKVPVFVHSVVILQGTKKFRIDLTAMD